ncbi:MAG: PLDc_N domain-containing protein [Pedosphaera sp.]|nr:PLDc_N domain-containing protein [Pedosphaera sp.]
MLGGLKILMVLFLLPLCLAFFAFWVWMLIDCIRSKALSDGEKIAWTLVIVFTHAIGALIYLVAGRKRAS